LCLQHRECQVKSWRLQLESRPAYNIQTELTDYHHFRGRPTHAR